MASLDYKDQSSIDQIDFEEFCKKYLNSSNGFYTDTVLPINSVEENNHNSTYSIKNNFNPNMNSVNFVIYR